MAETHGNSVASWTGVAILLVAAALVCLGLVLAQDWMWIAGVVGIVAGTAGWIILEKAGYGENGHRSKQARARQNRATEDTRVAR